MSAIRLINKIYFYPKLCCEIISFYNKSNLDYDKLTRDAFHKICKDNNIDTHPSILFNYFDGAGIKIAIMPVGCTEFWNYRIYHDGTITIISDYISRSEATLGALESAISIYNSISPNQIPNKDESKNENQE
jgi:hypothetical protein